MAEECNHDCSSCGADCAARDNAGPKRAEHGKIKKVIGIVSGKGGVGKSSVTALLASAAAARGISTAVLDADVTGPSIPKMFGVHTAAMSDGKKILPAVTAEKGIKLISVNMMLRNEDDPVLWRGPVISGLVKQFWDEVEWGDTDLMFVDMPPGTGDVPLTIFQSLPLDGIVIVTTPQDLVGMIVKKAVNMARMMNIPILGIVENMSYVVCPDCGRKISVFGESKVDAVALENGITNVVKVPIDLDLTKAADSGKIEEFENDYYTSFFENIDKMLSEKTKN